MNANKLWMTSKPSSTPFKGKESAAKLAPRHLGQLWLSVAHSCTQEPHPTRLLQQEATTGCFRTSARKSVNDHNDGLKLLFDTKNVSSAFTIQSH